MHPARPLIRRALPGGEPIPAVALATNSSVLTAISNDYDYSSVFSRQVEALVGKGDVVFGISTSGDSKNVVKGLEEARALGASLYHFLAIVAVRSPKYLTILLLFPLIQPH